MYTVKVYMYCAICIIYIYIQYMHMDVHMYIFQIVLLFLSLIPICFPEIFLKKRKIQKAWLEKHTRKVADSPQN